MSDSVWLHRWQPTRPRHPWDSPVSCHFLLQWMKVKSESEVAQSCLTPNNPMDCSPPASSVHGIFQARVLKWGAIAFSDHEILLSNKKEWSSNTCNSLDESHGNCAAWKKLLSKGTYYMLSLLYNFQNDKIKWLEINQWLPGMMKGKEHGGCGYKW